MPANRPEECDLQMAQAISKGNLEEALALYESGATLVPEPGQSATGTQAIREALTGFIAMNPTLTVDVPLVLESGETALLHSCWKLNGTGPDGPVNMEGKGIEVVRRQADGTWKFIIDNPWGQPA